MNECTLNELFSLFAALSDRTRLRLLELMANGEVSVGFLADSLGESQPKISRHLAYLRSAGLVSTRRDGKWIYYNLQKPTGEVAENVMNAAIGLTSAPIAAPPIRREDPRMEPQVSGRVDQEDFYIDDWQPQELDVFLL